MLRRLCEGRSKEIFSFGFLNMARLRSHSRRKVPLTREEFDSLKQVAIRPMRRTIPDEHRERLIEAGYIRVVHRSGNATALALTGAGISRLESGK